MNVNTRTLLSYGMASLLGVSAAALGQEAKPKSSILEEIIVTAQKRTENLQDVPVAVSAFTDEARDLIGIQSIQDFTNFTPGVTYTTSTDRMNIRGVGRYSNSLATSPSVATYGDGFYNYSNHQADTSALFTRQVEILRGPQGTLYGRNSIGGAVNVFMKRPTDTFQGEVRAGAGNFEQLKGEALFSGPIGDSVGFLVGAGTYQQDEGYVQNIQGTDEEGQQDEQFAMAQLAFSVGDVADVWFKYEYRKWDNGWGSSVNISPYNTLVRCTPATPTGSCNASLVNAGSLGPAALYNTGFSVVNGAPVALRPAAPQYTTPNPGVLNNRQVNHDTPGHEFLDPSNQFVLESTFHLGGADLKYIGGYYEYDFTLFTDFDNSDRKSYTYTPPSGANPVQIETQVVSVYKEAKQYYSNELNLTSNSDGAFQWIVGAYQYHEDYQQPVRVGTPTQAQLGTPLTLTGQPALPNPTRDYSSTNAELEVESLAAFGQVDYSFTDSFKGTLGLRYTEDKKDGQEFLRYVSWNPTTTGALTPAFDVSSTVAAPAGLVNPGVLQPDGFYARRLQVDSHATTGTAGLEWSPNDDGLVYLKYTRGYKDAAINAGGFAAIPYSEPEFVNAYETGAKFTFADRFQVNSSLFYYDYIGAQIPLSLVRGPGLPNVTQTFNLDEKIMGAEFETVWRATDALQVIFNYSYVEPKIDDEGCYSDSLDAVTIGPNLCATGGHTVKDNRVPFQPRNKVALNGLYTFNFTPGSLTASLSWLWRDTQYSSIFNRSELLIPSYDQTDLRMTWQSAENKYSVVGFVRNVFDDEGFESAGAAATASGITQTYSLTPPRQYGVEFQYRFDM